MSHYSEMEISALQKNEDELIASLRDHYGEDSVEVHDKAQSLMMYSGGKSDLKAHIIVRKKALSKALGHNVLSNDLGFERNSDGTYTVHVDKAGYPKSSEQKINSGYSERVAAKELKRKGYLVKRTVGADGVVKLTANKWS